MFSHPVPQNKPLADGSEHTPADVPLGSVLGFGIAQLKISLTTPPGPSPYTNRELATPTPLTHPTSYLRCHLVYYSSDKTEPDATLAHILHRESIRDRSSPSRLELRMLLSISVLRTLAQATTSPSKYPPDCLNRHPLSAKSSPQGDETQKHKSNRVTFVLKPSPGFPAPSGYKASLGTRLPLHRV